MNERIISLATIDRIMLKATGTINMDMDGMIAFGKILEDFGLDVLENAIVLQKHAGRKTIKNSDIRLAYDFTIAKKKRKGKCIDGESK